MFVTKEKHQIFKTDPVSLLGSAVYLISEEHGGTLKEFLHLGKVTPCNMFFLSKVRKHPVANEYSVLDREHLCLMPL